MEEKVVNEDQPPAYSSLFKSETFVDTSRAPGVIVTDVDEAPLLDTPFQNNAVRIVFIQKVLLIGYFQVLASFAIIAPTVLYSGVSDLPFWRLTGTLYYWILAMSVVHSVALITLFVWKDAGKTPYNFMFLTTLTFSRAAILVITAGLLQIQIELFAVWIFYIVLTLVLLIFSMFLLDSSLQFRARDAILVTAGLSIVMFCITLSFLRQDSYTVLSLFCLTATISLVCSYSVYRLQAMTGGEYRRPVTPSDYIAGALYTSVDLVYDVTKLVFPPCVKSKISNFFL